MTENDAIIPSQRLELNIVIHGLSRMQMLELRDEITDSLTEQFGCKFVMSSDGTFVVMERASPFKESPAGICVPLESECGDVNL